MLCMLHAVSVLHSIANVAFKSSFSQALSRLLPATGLFQLANVLRESTLGSIAISILFAVAALTHWQAGGGWLAATLGERVSQAATAAVYAIAGVPAFVDLTFDLASLHVDTHVLMTLAVLGTLSIGGALEVGCSLLACAPATYTIYHQRRARSIGAVHAGCQRLPGVAMCEVS